MVGGDWKDDWGCRLVMGGMVAEDDTEEEAEGCGYGDWRWLGCPGQEPS